MTDTAITRLQRKIAKAGVFDYEEVDHACFLHLKEKAADHGREGQVALKLLDLVEELLQ